MNPDTRRIAPAAVRCAVCAIEIPLDEAVVPELFSGELRAAFRALR